MGDITRHTKLTADQAFRLYQSGDVYGAERVKLVEYLRLLEQTERQQDAMKLWLLNPRAACKSAEWEQVHQLAEDLTWQNIPQSTRDQFSELESQLSGIIK